MIVSLIGEGKLDLKPVERRLMLGGALYHETMKYIHEDEYDEALHTEVKDIIERLQAEIRAEQDMIFEPEVVE